MKSLGTGRSLGRLLTLMTVLALGLAACGQAAAPTATAAPSTPTATSLPTLTPTPFTKTSGLYVDATQQQGAISPYVYGTNYGPWLFVPLQMQPFAEDGNLNIVRFPGGNWGDLNDIDPWQLDQYIAFTQQIEAEPYIHVRLENSTSEKAAELVHLANVAHDYNVRFWSIGNEPNLFGDYYSSERFNEEWREWALAMEAVDPDIQLVGPEINQFIPDPDNDYEAELERWLVEFLQANGDMVDVVSFHRYPFPSSVNAGPPSADELRRASEEWDETIPYVRALVHEHTGRDLPIAVTEVNSSWAGSSGGDTTLDSHLNAIWWGDALGRMIGTGAYMVQQFAISGQFGLMDNYHPKPIYYVYKMYQGFGDQRLFAASDVDLVSVFAAQRADGAITIMIINRSAEAQQVPLTIANGQAPGAAQAWLFDAQHAAEQVDDVNLAPESTLELGPESMLLLVLPTD
jgi:hypothetical protein